jgi:hypothetical protein
MALRAASLAASFGSEGHEYMVLTPYSLQPRNAILRRALLTSISSPAESKYAGAPVGTEPLAENTSGEVARLH